MGKGTIISGNGDGSYTVEMAYDRTKITAIIARLEQTITECQSIIDDPESTEYQIAAARIKKLSAEKRKAFLEDPDKVPQNDEITAWCADLTKDMTGDVGIIEIGRERENGVNIQPGYAGNAAYNGTRDGQLIPLMAQHPASSYFNMAVLPGTQKWKPMYRYGIITAIDNDADTCSVSLEAIASSQKGLNINQSSTLSNVPINYMNCNSDAFSVGDEVIVKFLNYDWSTPQVIGFKENPKPCSAEFVIQISQDYDGVVGWPGVDEFVIIEIEDTDGNYYGSLYIWGDDLEYWTLNGTVWEYQPYIDETGEDYQYKITASYDTVSQKWTVYYDDWDISGPLDAPDPAAVYYVVVNCTNCPNATQYPYRYKDADQGNTDDAVPVGELTVSVPVFKRVSAVLNPSITWPTFTISNNLYKYCEVTEKIALGDPMRCAYSSPFAYTHYCDIIRESAYQYITTVISSIPYRLTERALLATNRPFCCVVSNPLPDTPSTSYDLITSGGTITIIEGDTACLYANSFFTSVLISGEVLSIDLAPGDSGTDALDTATKTATGAGGQSHTLSSLYTPPDAVSVEFRYTDGGFFYYTNFDMTPVGIMNARELGRIAYNYVDPILT